MLRDDCLRCGHALTPYGHWGICPECDPTYHAWLVDRTRWAPKLELLDKGIPKGDRCADASGQETSTGSSGQA